MNQDRWTLKQGVLTSLHPCRSSKIEDQVAIHFGIELEVEVIE